MITALQQNVHGVQMVDRFEKMLEYMASLQTIPHLLVFSLPVATMEQGRKDFNLMTQVCKITPSTEHYPQYFPSFIPPELDRREV